MLPVLTLPKLKLTGLAANVEVDELTVSVAALLVTLPVLLVTTTVNVLAPAAVAAGVV